MKARKTKKENEVPEGWKISSKRCLEMRLTDKEEKHDQRKLQLNRNKKFFDKAQQFLVFLHKT